MIGKSEKEMTEVKTEKIDADQTGRDFLLIEEDTVGLEREEFRVYLVEHGVMETLIKALTDLFLEEDKPDDPIDYIKSFLIERHRPEGEASVLRTDLRDARKEIKDLKKQVSSLIKRLEKYEAVEEDEN